MINIERVLLTCMIFIVVTTILILLFIFMIWYLVEEGDRTIKEEEEKEVKDTNETEIIVLAEEDMIDLDSLVTEDEGEKEVVNTETYTELFQYENCYELGVSQADVGLVVPFQAETSLFTFRPFDRVEEALKEKTIEALQREFGDQITRDFVESKWTAGNVFYVLSFKSEGKDDFIGCVGVDRLQFYPFISNLVVHEKYRGKKYGQLLLRLAERYAERFQFPSVKLWCAEKLVPYYLKQGYVKERYEEEQQVFILYKTFRKE